MRAGVGFYRGHGVAAGQAAARQALANGAISRPDLALAFCAASVGGEQFLQGVRSVLGDAAPVIGGTTLGLIDNDHTDYTGNPGAVAVLQWDCPSPVRIASAGGLDQDCEKAGRAVVDSLGGTLEEQLLIMFYDSVRTPPSATSRWALNSSTPLLAGIEAAGGTVPAIGAGLIGDFRFTASQMFCGGETSRQHVVAATVPQTPGPYIEIMHGCVPLDGTYHTITKIAGDKLYELDGLPIVEVIDELFGSEEWRQQRPVVNLLTIGRHLGERYGEVREEDYVNRLIIGVLPDGSGIEIFEPDFAEGDEILFMLRDTGRMVRSTRENTTKLMNRVLADGNTPAFGFYIDCVGRTAQESHMLEEEAAQVQAVFKQHAVPLLGIYSGVEIAPFRQRNCGLDWTGVLTILTEEEVHARG